MKKKNEPSYYGWMVKVVALVLALAGVFWARTQLEENVQTPAKPAPASEQPPIPAKVEFGK